VEDYKKGKKILKEKILKEPHAFIGDKSKNLNNFITFLLNKDPD
jgi:hypothetical protein